MVRPFEPLWHHPGIALRAHEHMTDTGPHERELLMCESCGVVRSVSGAEDELVLHSRDQGGGCDECGCDELSAVLL